MPSGYFYLAFNLLSIFNKTGKDLITAAAVGYEIGTRLCDSTFLGLNTVKDVISTVPASVISGLPSGVMDTISGNIWFPETIATA